MMKCAELYGFAENRDILVINGRLKKSPSMSISDNGFYSIIIDNRQIRSNAEETVIAAHEIGHCETGAFYNEHSLELRSRMEYRADKWAIKKLVPEDELIKAFKCGILEIWELAEYFDVTEDFMIKVCEFYGYYQGAV
ncbi:MAG: ImmA/IrrE family metallo-endopeptidase [Ruminococcus sp.]|nr:ImmA/IrrE family metallo-endopeptidase [Ruminococcus sp.]